MFDFKSNTKAAAEMLDSFLFVKVTRPDTGSLILDVNLILALYVDLGSIIKLSSLSSEKSGCASRFT